MGNFDINLENRGKKGDESCTCSNGEIGRRARLRIWFRKECGFKSLFEHFFPLRKYSGMFNVD